ncbi:MAG TPA: hypothetical protein VFV19_11365 [Candidatus Polarisedimenticolaceae bacterium]|nr:hypothetical protein [Candidatus Polarisedimenticolaceae bacterium]
MKTLLGLALGTAVLCGCHDAPRDAAPAPPITAAKPAEPAPAQAEAPPAPAPTPQPKPVEKAEAKPPAPAAAPHDTSLPGAIPPSPLPDPSAKPVDKPVDPLQWLQDSQARQADYKRRLEDADAKLQAAAVTTSSWEKTILAFKNPYLPRPVLSPEDAATIKGMNGIQRVEWANGKLADARTAMDDAKKALDDLKANPPLN